MRIISWNVNGLRSVLKNKELDFEDLFTNKLKPDILCLSEIKMTCKVNNILDSILPIFPYRYYSHCTTQTGRHGVIVFSKYKPKNIFYKLNGIEEANTEGRYIELEFNKFHLISVYTPNSGQKLERLEFRTKIWDHFIEKRIKYLIGNGNEIIYTGDLNVVHLETDTYNFKSHRNKLAGVTDIERSNFNNLLNNGLIDAYRELHPKTTAYTYFTYLFKSREHNKGMLLDYFIMTPGIFKNVKDIKILNNINGSDHVPILCDCNVNLDDHQIGGSVNKKGVIVCQLQQVANRETNKFKINAYNKVIDQLKKLPSITSLDDLKDITGIGIKIKTKIEDILQYGKLKNNITTDDIKPTIHFHNELMKIHGIGHKKAQELINKGVTTITQLKDNKSLLSKQQQIGLKYFSDLQDKIPRSEMDLHNELLNELLTEITFSIVGSYRRGTPVSGDIDVLICSNKENLMSQIIHKLTVSGYLVDTLANGKKKFMGIVNIPGYKNRRFDILITKSNEYPFALLYFTGNFHLNILMRKQAAKLHLRLNEKSLIDTKTGKNLHVKTEKDIFEILELKYLEPNERN